MRQGIIEISISYRILFFIERVSLIEYYRQYIGNIIFSVLAFNLILFLHDRNISIINKWVTRYDINSDLDRMTSKLNDNYKVYFGFIHFIVVLLAILLKIYIEHIILKNIQMDILLTDILLSYLVFSLLISGLGHINSLRILASTGIKINEPFEIREAYIQLTSLMTRNILILGIYMSLYGSVIIIWAFQYEYYLLAVIIDVGMILIILFLFVFGLNGIRHGILISKKIIKTKAIRELNTVPNVHFDVIDINNIKKAENQYYFMMMRQYHLTRINEINEVKVWAYDNSIIIQIILTISIPLLITIFEFFIGN